MTDKKIRLLIEAENAATAKIEEAAKSVDKFGNEISETDAKLGRFIDKSGRMREANGRFVNTSKETAKALDDVSSSAQQAGNELNKAGTKGTQGLLQLGNQAASTRAAIANLLMTAGLFGIGGQAIAMADEYKLLEGRLKLATDSTEEFTTAQARLSEMANDTRQSLSATTKLYIGIAPALKEAGREQEAIFRVVDSVNKALVISGATAQESAASILQLTQALGSGVLRGDEFNSIMENGRGIAQALADGLGLPIGSLRKLAEEGKLTSSIVIEALLQQNEVISEKYGGLPVTVGQAMQQVQNKTLEAVGAWDKATGASAALSGSLTTLSEHIEEVAFVAGVLATIFGARLAAKLATHIASTTAATIAQQKQAASALYLSRSQDIATASTGRLTLAQRTLTASTVAGTTAARGLAASLAFLGGPLGVAVALGVAGAAAYMAYGDELDSTKTRALELKEAEEKHTVALQKAKDAAYKYAGATEAVRKELRAEAAAAIDAARAELKLAQARVESAKQKLRLVRSLENNQSGSIKEGTRYAKAEGVGESHLQHLAHQQGLLSQEVDHLKELEAEYKKFGKTKVELDKINHESSYQTAKSNEIVTKSQEELRKLLNQSDADGKKLAKTFDRQKTALMAQNIALKEGELAAYRYRLQQQGLSKDKIDALVAIKAENIGLQKLKQEQKKSTKAKKKGATESEKAAERIKKAFENQSNALDIQNIKLREGEEAAERHRLKLQGFSQTQIDQLIATRRANKALEEQQQQRDKNAKDLQQRTEQAKQFYESQKQSLEKRRIELTKGKAAAEAYTATLKHLTPVQIAELTASRKHNEALEAQNKKREEAKEKAEKLAQQENEELKRLKDRNKALHQTSLAAYRASLENKKFSKNMVEEATALEYNNRLFAERQKLQQARNKLSPNVRQQYQRELKQQGFNDKDIKHLSARKMQIEQDKITQQLEKQREQLQLGTAAYRELELAAMGFNKTQIKQITAQEQANEKLKQTKVISDTVYNKMSENLLKTVTGGKADWSGLIDYMIQEAMKLYVVKPLMDGLFGKQTSTGSSGGFLGSILGGLFAKGGAFSQGQQVHAYAKGGTFTNQTYSQPTFFNFDSGKLGVMGEAGPEAVLPLHPASNGGLGVLAKIEAEAPPVSIALAPQVLVDLAQAQRNTATAITTPIEVNVYNNGEIVKAKTETRPNNQGGMTVDIFLEKIREDISQNILSGGEVGEAIADTFDLNSAMGAMR